MSRFSYRPRVGRSASVRRRAGRAGRGWWRAHGRCWSARRARAAPRCRRRSGSTLSRRLRSIVGWSPPGRSVRPIEPGEQQVPGEHQLRDVLLAVRRPEGDRALGVARGVVDDEVQAGQRQRLQVGELRDVVGLGELVLPAEQHPGGLLRHPGHRVREQVPVAGVDVGGGVVRAGHRRDAPHVVDVPVRDQHRGGLEPVLADHLGDAGGGVLAGVDDHALAARPGGDDVAVGAPRAGGEACDEHDDALLSCSGSLARCSLPRAPGTTCTRTVRSPAAPRVARSRLPSVVTKKRRRTQLARAGAQRQQLRRAERDRRRRRTPAGPHHRRRAARPGRPGDLDRAARDSTASRRPLRGVTTLHS